MKSIVILSTFALFSILVACQSQKNNINKQDVVVIVPGKSTYKKYCSACHGNKGDLGIAEATDLQTSSIDINEIIDVITEGRNKMPAMKGKISGTEIENIAKYILEFRNINNDK